jgi:hypothetical protein
MPAFGDSVPSAVGAGRGETGEKSGVGEGTGLVGSGGGVSVGSIGVGVTRVGASVPVLQAVVGSTPRSVMSTRRNVVCRVAVIIRWLFTTGILTYQRRSCKQPEKIDVPDTLSAVAPVRSLAILGANHWCTMCRRRAWPHPF